VSERNDLGSLLTPPFGEAAKSAFLENLSDAWKLAGFMDFVVRTLLARDHHSVFWGDRMMTLDKSMGFLEDPAFARAWEAVRGAHEYDQYDNKQSIAWRMNILVWAARQAVKLPDGDFVECGVFQGDMSYVVYHAAGLVQSGRKMHLFDSFEGIDPARVAEGEYGLSSSYVEQANVHYRKAGLYESVCARFASLPGVSVHKGSLPEALEGRAPERIAWLHIDLNAAKPEVDTLAILFDRVVPGGIVLLDDYGWLVLKAQKDAEDSFFRARGYEVLELPTGQGLVVKRADVVASRPSQPMRARYEPMRFVETLKGLVRNSFRNAGRLEAIVEGVANQSSLINGKLEEVIEGLDNQSKLMNRHLQEIVNNSRAQTAHLGSVVAAMATQPSLSNDKLHEVILTLANKSDQTNRRLQELTAALNEINAKSAAYSKT
jgi:O-methyltransferase